jgi:hypothetical protein
MAITSAPLITAFMNLPEMLFGHSVQPSFKYIASFLENPFNSKKFSAGPMPIIAPWQFQSVTIPTYNFEKISVKYGTVPRSFPVLNFNESMEINLKLREDENGTIDFFIHWCQRNLIDSQGFHIPPMQNRIGHLVIEISDRLNLPVVYYIFRNLFYLTADDVRYSYDSSEVIDRNVTFGCEILETYYTKAAIINTLQSKVGSLF